MAEVRAEPAQRVVATGRPRERFLTPWMWVALGGVRACSRSPSTTSRIHDDGVLYYNFVRRLFGTDVVAQAYQFGSAFWTAPFYLVSQLVASRGELDHYHAGEVGTVVASNAAAVLALYLGWRILRELDLPREPGAAAARAVRDAALLLRVLEPGCKHAADTLYMTAAVWFLLLAAKRAARRYLVARRRLPRADARDAVRERRDPRRA